MNSVNYNDSLFKTKRQQQHKVNFGARLIHGEDITAELRRVWIGAAAVLVPARSFF